MNSGNLDLSPEKALGVLIFSSLGPLLYNCTLKLASKTRNKPFLSFFFTFTKARFPSHKFICSISMIHVRLCEKFDMRCSFSRIRTQRSFVVPLLLIHFCPLFLPIYRSMLSLSKIHMFRRNDSCAIEGRNSICNAVSIAFERNAHLSYHFF